MKVSTSMLEFWGHLDRRGMYSVSCLEYEAPGPERCQLTVRRDRYSREEVTSGPDWYEVFLKVPWTYLNGVS